MKKEWIITAAVAVVVGAVAFFGGMKYQQRRTMLAIGNGGGGQFRQFGAGGPGGQFGGRGGNAQFGGGANGGTGGGRTAGFRPILGEIISADDKSITVKLDDGSTKIVLLSDSTQINKADTATKADLKVGEKVSVFGNQGTEGTVTAQNIQLNPTMMRMMGNATPAASPANR